MKYFFILIVWTTDPSQQINALPFHPVSTFQVRLPAGNDTSIFNLLFIFEIHLIVSLNIICHQLVFIPDSAEINNLINNLQNSTNAVKIIQLFNYLQVEIKI